MNTEFYFPTATVPQARHGLRHKIVVRDYEAALLCQHGKLARQLASGRHIVWGFGYAISHLRKRVLAVAGQEVLSADNLGVKLSLAVTMQVVDPAKAAHAVQD